MQFVGFIQSRRIQRMLSNLLKIIAIIIIVIAIVIVYELEIVWKHQYDFITQGIEMLIIALCLIIPILAFIIVDMLEGKIKD